MAFIIENNTVISFAEFQDVVDRDQRIFGANEGLTDDVVEGSLIRATERILTQLRSTDWWRSYYLNQSTNFSYSSVADIPPLDPNRIQDRKEDFTDLCVYVALSDFILPGVADFANDDSAERKKMGYYKQRATELFGELVTAGDWYNFDGTGTISSKEKMPGQFNLKRVR